MRPAHKSLCYLCYSLLALSACSSVLSGRSDPDPAPTESPSTRAPNTTAAPTTPAEPLPVGLTLELSVAHSNITAQVTNDGNDPARFGRELQVDYSVNGQDFSDARLGASWRTDCEAEAPSCITLHRGTGIVAPPITRSEAPSQCLPGIAAAHRLRAGHYRVSVLSCDGRTITEQSVLVAPEAY